MAAAAPRADFKLLLVSVNPAQVQSIVAELMELFPIDQKTALGAVQNAPIILVGGMTPAMAANLRTHVPRLAKLGAQLRLTAEPVGKLKQFRWPAPPPATLRPANIFMCPTCGERFVVQRWAPARQAAAPEAPAEAAAAAEAIPEAEALPAEGAAEIPEAESINLAAADEGPIPEAEPMEAEARPLASVSEEEPIEDLIEAARAEPEPGAIEPAAPPQPEPARRAPEPAIPMLRIAGEPAAQPRPAAAQAVAPMPRPQPQAPTQAAPTQPKLQPRQPSSAALKPVALTLAPKAASEPPAGARYDVSVAKVRGPQQDNLARLLVARLGMPPEEAQKQCERTVILACKGGTAAEADEWRKALVGIGLTPRIRKH